MTDVAEASPPVVWIYETVQEVTITNPADSTECEDDDGRKFSTSWGVGSSLAAGGLRLDVTIVLNQSVDSLEILEPDPAAPRPPLFSLASVNQRTAPSVEVPWSQLLALSFSPRQEPPVLTVGRHASCSVQLQDPRVSLRHFEIVAQKLYSDCGEKSELGDVIYTCFLNDLSSNGTAINGRVVGKGQTAQLRSGDEIVVLAASVVGEEQKIAFLFRNATEVFSDGKASETEQGLGLTELVSCPICMLVIHRCVALTPCMHNFCSACCSEWMSRGPSFWNCPLCRERTEAVVRNHAMDEVVSAVSSACPDMCRSEQERADMDSRDQLYQGGGAGGMQALHLRAGPTSSIAAEMPAISQRHQPTSQPQALSRLPTARLDAHPGTHAAPPTRVLSSLGNGIHLTCVVQ